MTINAVRYVIRVTMLPKVQLHEFDLLQRRSQLSTSAMLTLKPTRNCGQLSISS